MMNTVFQYAFDGIFGYREIFLPMGKKRKKIKSGLAVPPQPSGAGSWGIPRQLIVLLTLAAAIVSIAGIKAFSNVLGPIFLALMLTVAVQPLRETLMRRGLPRWVGTLVSLLAVWLILIVLIGTLIVSAAQLATLLPTYADQANNLLAGVQTALTNAGVDTSQAKSMFSDLDPAQLASAIESALGDIIGVLTNIFFILALLLFMAVDGMNMDKKMSAVARARPEIAYAFASFATGTRKYLIVSTVFGLIVAVLDGGALWAMGVPLPILWAVLSFITNYIPNIGFLIGLVPPAILALLEGGPTLMIWVIVVYSAINVVIQSVIQPKFVGDSVGISVTITFLSLVFWAFVLGPLGALLAVPLTLLAKALLVDIDPSSRWVNILIGDKAPDEPEARDAEDPGSEPEVLAGEPAESGVEQGGSSPTHNVR